mgnify:CR=1 FL=1
MSDPRILIIVAAPRNGSSVTAMRARGTQTEPDLRHVRSDQARRTTSRRVAAHKTEAAGQSPRHRAGLRALSVSRMARIGLRGDRRGRPGGSHWRPSEFAQAPRIVVVPPSSHSRWPHANQARVAASLPSAHLISGVVAGVAARISRLLEPQAVQSPAPCRRTCSSKSPDHDFIKPSLGRHLAPLLRSALEKVSPARASPCAFRQSNRQSTRARPSESHMGSRQSTPLAEIDASFGSFSEDRVFRAPPLEGTPATTGCPGRRRLKRAPANRIRCCLRPFAKRRTICGRRFLCEETRRACSSMYWMTSSYARSAELVLQ